MGADEADGVSRVGINGATCAYGTIQQAVNAAVDGDTIQIADGVFFENVNISGKEIAIIGDYDSTCTTANSGSTRVDGSVFGGSTFDILSSSTVTFTNMEISWGTGTGGGLDVRGSSTVLLDNTDIHDNHGSTGGGLNIAFGSSVIAQNDSDIYDNTASSQGGGGTIYGDFSGFGTTSDIYRNCAPHGGGFTVSRGTLSLDNADVIDNEAVDAAGEGGGIRAYSGAVVNLTNSVYVGETGSQDNTAYVGAGIYADQSTINLSTSTTTIYHNTATNDGGGIYATNGAIINVDAARVGNTATYDNQAVDGGGAYISGSNSELNMSNGADVQYGNASSDGGGIFAEDGATVTIDASFVNNNTANAWGGGIYVLGGATAPTINIQNGSQVNNNTADYGGGIYVRDNGATVTIDASSVDNNSADFTGGGIRQSLAGTNNSVNLQNGSTLSDNTANDGVGGGWASYGDHTLDINVATIQNNTASTDGGAIHIDGLGGDTPVLNAYDPDIRFNDALNGDGGGIYNGLASLNIYASTQDSYIAVNSASNGNGGGIYHDSTTTLRTRGTSGYTLNINTNGATNNGGGIYIENGFLDMYGDHLMSSNSAGQDGGGIYALNASAWLDDFGNAIPKIWVNNATAGDGGWHLCVWF